MNSNSEQSVLRDKPEYLERTIGLKNDYISQLIEELKMTQQLHSQLKTKYLGDQQRLKAKINELEQTIQKLKRENIEIIKKYKAVQTRYISQEQKLNSLSSQLKTETKQLRDTIQAIKLENIALHEEKEALTQQIRSEQQNTYKAEARIKQLGEEIDRQKMKVIKLQEAYTEKQQEWEKANNSLICNLKQSECKNTEKNQHTLSQMESRIRKIMAAI